MKTVLRFSYLTTSEACVTNLDYILQMPLFSFTKTGYFSFQDLERMHYSIVYEQYSAFLRLLVRNKWRLNIP